MFSGLEGKNIIYKSTMQQSRHHCVAVYLEEEYDMLALESALWCKVVKHTNFW
jgi:hypothetical protein